MINLTNSRWVGVSETCLKTVIILTLELTDCTFNIVHGKKRAAQNKLNHAI